MSVVTGGNRSEQWYVAGTFRGPNGSTVQSMERTGWNVIIFLTRHYSALSAVNVDFTACYVLH